MARRTEAPLPPAPRWKSVESLLVMFRLLFFRGNLLDRFETIDCADPMGAIHEAAKRYSDDKVELWAEDRRLAIFRPARRRDRL